MAKDQQIGLLSDIVNQLRQLNRANVRDKLQENEQAKRQLKLAEVVEDTAVENTGLISGAEDFQRRFIAGQARTEFNAAIKDSPAKLYAQDIQHELTKNNMHFLHSIDTTLTKQFEMWKMLLAGQKTQLAFDQKIHKIDDRRYMNGLRNANEKRLEGIRGGASGAALGMSGRGKFFEGIGDEEEEDKGLSTGQAVAAGALSAFILGKIKAVASWFGKGIKWGKGLLGRFAAIGLALFSKNPKQRRYLGPAQKKMAKNPRLWPVLLASLVAANILDGFMGADDEFAMDNKETAASGESSILSTIGNGALTALNVAFGFQVANFLTKGWLAKKTTAILATSWKLLKNAKLAKTLASVGLALAGAASLPALAVALGGAVALYYAGDIVEAVVKSAAGFSKDRPIGTTNETAGGNMAEMKSTLQKDIIGVSTFMPAKSFNPDMQALMQSNLEAAIVPLFVRVKDNLPGIAMLRDSLIQNGFTDAQIKHFMDLAGVSFKGPKGVSTKGQDLPWMKAGANSKATKEFMANMKNSKQLMSVAEVALRIKKEKEKKAQFVEMNKTTADKPFPSFGTIPYEFRQSKNGGVGTPEMTDHINSLISPANGTNVINTDASSNSSTVNIIYQDHILKDYSGMNSYTNTSGEKWSW